MTEASPAAASPWFASLGGEGVAQLLSLALEGLGVSMSVKQMNNGLYVQASPNLDRLFERTESSVVGSSDSELMRPDEAAAMRRVELQVMGQTTPQVHEHRLDLGGRRREFTLVRMPIGDRFMLALWMERSTERQREVQLQKALAQIEQHQAELTQTRQLAAGSAGRDEVSGLQQRSLFDELLQREIDLSVREHREFALVLISIDTPLGQAHPMQREALGRLLRGNTRAMDAASHLGDDRFGVLLSGVGLATAHSRMEHLRRQCMQQLVVVDGKDLGLAVSMGVASFPHSAGTHDDLLGASEAALRQAQRRGQNQVALATISLV